MGRKRNLNLKEKGLEHVQGRKTVGGILGGSLELIECPRQPGNLRISRYACAQRHLLAQKKSHFGIADRWSLETCGNCPEGRKRSEALRANSDSNMANGGRAARARKRRRVDLP
jgi:hypothetical protein